MFPTGETFVLWGGAWRWWGWLQGAPVVRWERPAFPKPERHRLGPRPGKGKPPCWWSGARRRRRCEQPVFLEPERVVDAEHPWRCRKRARQDKLQDPGRQIFEWVKLDDQEDCKMDQVVLPVRKKDNQRRNKASPARLMKLNEDIVS